MQKTYITGWVGRETRENFFKHHKKKRKMKYYFMLLNMELCLWYVRGEGKSRLIVFTQGVGRMEAYGFGEGNEWVEGMFFLIA